MVRGIVQGIFLILVMTAIGLTVYDIGTTSTSMTELMGKATVWGLLIGLLAALGWEKL